MTLSAKGMYSQAVEEYRAAIAAQGGKPLIYLGYLGNAYARLGNETEARNILAQMGEVQNSFIAPAMVYVGLENKDQALSWLERGAAWDDTSRVWINVDPVFDSLRSEPRFRNIIQLMHLPE